MKIGILGGGQLARMMIQAGSKLGLSFRIYCAEDEEPTRDIPGAAASFERMIAPYDDEHALARFAAGLNAVTFEFENVPARTLEILTGLIPTRPNPRALAIGQDREQEKNFFRSLGIPTTQFRIISESAELDEALSITGLPAVLKTTRLGYDGKGQAVVRSKSEAQDAFKTIGKPPCIVENLVPFSRELSCLAARSAQGEIQFYPLVENHHRGGILRTSIAPAPDTVGSPLERQAHDYLSKIVTDLDYVGVIAVEFFEVNGGLIANEMAPRVHNSGHWTIEGAKTSQFENHIRAVADMPLGDSRAKGDCEMENIIGEVPSQVSHGTLHLYGKTPRQGRKLGHVTRVNTYPAQ